MTAAADHPGRITIRTVRLASGLVLLTYLFLHLVNHALGIASLDLAEAGLKLAKKIWQSPPGTIALYGAAAVHLALALYTLFERRHWSLPPVEWLRLYAGFSLPVLLIDHGVNTRLGGTLYHYDPVYRNIVASIVTNGNTGWQLALLAPGWLHGCLGVWIGLRRYDWARRLKPLLLAFVIAMPCLSGLGFYRMTEALENDPSGGGAAYYVPSGESGAAMKARLRVLGMDLMVGYVALVAGAVAAGFAQRRLMARQA